MELGINGSLTLQITDHISKGVTTVECCNLITNYGLQRLMGPKNLRDRVATHICFGYRNTEPEFTDNNIPSNYFFVPIKEESSTRIDELTARGLWTHELSAFNSLEVGTVINHVYLAYKDSDGIYHPLTSLLLRDKTGELYEYTHSENTTLYTSYTITLSITSSTLSSDYSSIQVSENQVQSVGVYLKDLREPNTYYENNPDTTYAAPALLKESAGLALGDGSWKQTYRVDVRSYSWASSFEFKIGFAIFQFRPKNYRVAASYELELIVKQPPPEVLAPRAATGVVISPPAYINYDEDRRRIKVSAPPYQWIDIFCNGLFISSHYIGPLGYIHRSSRVTKAWDNDGKLVEMDEYLLSSGNRMRVVSRTLIGSVETMLPTPDLQADDLIAIWWPDENTIRVVSRINDTIKIRWSGNVYNDDNGGRGWGFVDSGKFVKCTTLYDEEKDYYYGDIDMTGYGKNVKPWVSYTVTDEAGNVFDGLYSDKGYYANNYMPGMSYDQCVNYAKNSGLQTGTPYEYNAEVNKYSFTLRLLSAEIK